MQKLVGASLALDRESDLPNVPVQALATHDFPSTDITVVPATQAVTFDATHTLPANGRNSVSQVVLH
jgi:hypothetical protein